MTSTATSIDDVVNDAADQAMQVYRDGQPNAGTRAHELFVQLLERNASTVHLTRVEPLMRHLRQAVDQKMGALLIEGLMRHVHHNHCRP